MRTIRIRKMFTSLAGAGVKGLRSMTNRRTVWFSLVLSTVVVLVASIVRPVDTQLGSQVEGSLFALVEDRRLPVSGITIYVKNTFTSIRSRNVTTDANGRFVTPKQPPGTYQLCWEATGFKAGCTINAFVIEDSTVLLSPVEITPEVGVIGGRITLLDGTSISSPLPSADNCCTDVNHFLSFNGLDTPETACNYYQAIGAIPSGECIPRLPDGKARVSQPAGITFSRWKKQNGLAVDPDADGNGNPFDDDDITGEASALYLNAVDLNLGRSMHGKKSVVNGITTVAYYVCNYPTLEDARAGTQLIACVAMDYTSDKPFIKFYIFGPEDDLRIGVDLDKRGVKFVPGTCTVCHGATNNPRRFSTLGLSFGTVLRFPDGTVLRFTDPDVGGHFLPFDLDNFEYLPDSITFSRRAQESKFRRLNQLILSTSTINRNDPDDPTPAAKELIAGWYPRSTKGQQLSSFVPPDWVGQEELYMNVVKPSCRTCHVAMRQVDNITPFVFFPLDFRSFKDFSNLKPFVLVRVCTDTPSPNPLSRAMPNSKETFDRFWLSKDTQPGISAPNVLSKFLQTACPDPRTTMP